ncbi:heme transporter CcmC [Sulfurospirillum halorespirans]|nr:heme transporter CcmC [Sulfurospirillum halorespirans]
MDLSKEVNELKKSFKEGNMLTKIIMGIGFFITLSSLTELSSKIIAWKGFIWDGLRFYQSIFVEPVSSLSSHIGLNYTELEIHVATISSICIAIGMRVQIMGQKVAFRNISEKYGKEVIPNLTFFLIAAIVAPIGIWLWYGLNNPTIYIWWVIFVSMFLPLFIVVPKIILTKFCDYEFFEQGNFSYFKSYYIYIFSLLLIICILAAINTGLTEQG